MKLTYKARGYADGIAVLVLYVALMAWWFLYAIPLTLNHLGIWPFSYLGDG